MLEQHVKQTAIVSELLPVHNWTIYLLDKSSGQVAKKKKTENASVVLC